jgi:hypothetical protein
MRRKDYKRPDPLFEIVDLVPALPCNQLNEFHQRLLYLKPGEILCATYPEGTSKNDMRRLRINHMSHAQWILGKGAVSTAIRDNKIYIWPKPVVTELGPTIYRAVSQEEAKKDNVEVTPWGR